MFCFSSFVPARDPGLAAIAADGVATSERDLALLLLLFIILLLFDGANISERSLLSSSSWDEFSGSLSSLLLLLLLLRFSILSLLLLFAAAMLDCHDGGRGSDGLRTVDDPPTILLREGVVAVGVYDDSAVCLTALDGVPGGIFFNMVCQQAAKTRQTTMKQ